MAKHVSEGAGRIIALSIYYIVALILQVVIPLERPSECFFLCQTGRVRASLPAKGGGRSVKKETDSNTNVIWICVYVCVRCGTAVLFTCTSVLNYPGSLEG
jgi:low affinity Fe/Cu permease